MKRIAILGSSGSIGQTTLTAIRTHALPLSVVSLTSHTSVDRLIADGRACGAEALCSTGTPVEGLYHGFDGLVAMLDEHPVDIVLNAISGFAGLRASLAVLERGIDLALANKESVICGGALLFETARRHNCRIIPVDSEHSAIASLLRGHEREHVQSLILTASGGPFRTLESDRFAHLKAADALAHPTWQMGKKITIDSATLANKALEVIEASYLFGFSGDEIEVVVHPQSIVHSMIRTTDGAVYAQLSKPDMSLAIIGALLDGPEDIVDRLDFDALSLSFERPDLDRFPLLGLAFEILRRGDLSTIAFNAADEVAVAAFLEGTIPYPVMIDVVRRTVDHEWEGTITSYQQIVEVDTRARRLAKSLL
ncbi:MAG TPA: 1-deoxy-D-xylulose-5-phosphate reductoisomerase [Sphaerochaeta sp.]|nr:1-deoxy-D-xylulose-5-phosphate reductoisomerase [Sphaerochaeta sp.]